MIIILWLILLVMIPLVNLTQSDRKFHVSKDQNAILKKSTVFRGRNGIIRSDYYRIQWSLETVLSYGL